MVAITGCTCVDIIPNLGKKAVIITTPATADSANTIDLTDSTVTGGTVFSAVTMATAWDATTGDSVTVTASTTTLTIDAAGGTADHTYNILVIGTTNY
jgi:hypothetical protein